MMLSILGEDLSRKLIKEKISSQRVILYWHMLLDYIPFCIKIHSSYTGKMKVETELNCHTAFSWMYL